MTECAAEFSVDALMTLTDWRGSPIYVFMRHGISITAGKKGDAECICEALIDYGSELEREGRRWAVRLPLPRGPELPAILAALKDCLDENAITLVKVTIDGQAYVMEGTE